MSERTKLVTHCPFTPVTGSIAAPGEAALPPSLGSGTGRATQRTAQASPLAALLLYFQRQEWAGDASALLKGASLGWR